MTDIGIETRPAGGSPVSHILAWRRAWLHMDSNDAVVRFATSLPGKALLYVTFVAFLFAYQLQMGGLLVIAGSLALLTVFPTRRLEVLLLGALAYLYLSPFGTTALRALPQALTERYGPIGIDLKLFGLFTGLVFFVFAALVLAAQARFADKAVVKRPLMCLMALFWFLVAVAMTDLLPARGQIILWSFIGVFATYFWYLAYAMADQKVKNPTPNWKRLGLFRPMWGAPWTPFGKGAAYLAKFEAADETDLAKVRLRAIKLICWGAILYWLEHALTYIGYSVVHISTLDEAVIAQAQSGLAAFAGDWAAVIYSYFLHILTMCAFGHFVVSVIRMTGYGIPRNSVRPLAARSLADFWNRYYFYFKELLVDFFFYPAFLRYFKRNTKMRLAFATFCAAGAGNFLFHAMQNIDLAFTGGAVAFLQQFEGYLIYCLALSAGLIASQLYGRKPQPTDGFLRYEVLPRLNVGLFFCLIAVFGDPTSTLPVSERIGFVLNLFGVTL
ncbi:hypothetical protein [Rhizobium sp. L1K21]|uniref:hypothetical protein n=1 Tax=Rhizobium sp. L1K21 TaxID=2954933 RepID=UPI002092C549|nr:hypothetical protein [Rhizobium sp. L1K21]MCO6184798.1 hypothetical protein [Rhizobium sp. L1K21]